MIGLLLQFLPMIVAPIFTALVKRWVPKVPKPALPVIAAVSGALLDSGITAAQNMTQDPMYSAAVGLAAIGLREIADQTTKAAV